MNYEELDPALRRGIATIVEDWENRDDYYYEYDEDRDMIAGILQLMEDTTYNKDGMADLFEYFCNRYYERLGYLYKRAVDVKKKLVKAMYDKDLDFWQLRRLLREFDEVSSCIARSGSYPLPLIQSLYAISNIEKNANLTRTSRQYIYYITCKYRGCPKEKVRRMFLLRDDEEHPENKSSFFEEQTVFADRQPLRRIPQRGRETSAPDKTALPDDEQLVRKILKSTSEMPGCCVKVRFPNGAVYRYNCRFDEVHEGSVVLVSGAMEGMKGTVIERTEEWDFSSYMQEVSAIVE